MSLLQNLELTMLADNIRSTTLVVGEVTHTVPLDSILNCPRNTRMSHMILRYCELRDETPDRALKVFSRRNGHLFPHILHYADTGHLIYPADLDLGKTLVRDLCHYGLIRIKDGYCHQCLMEYFKMHGLGDFREQDGGGVPGPNADNNAFAFYNLNPETVVIKTEMVGGDMFAIRAWGTPKLLDELFHKKKTENDATYYQLSMRVTVIYTDLCEFLKEIANIVCCMVKKLGFRITCLSTWSDESSQAKFGQWLLFREVPSILPAGDVKKPVRPKKSLKARLCPCLVKKEKVDPRTATEYPELPKNKDKNSPTKVKTPQENKI